jgi:acyl-CoA hydrolase
VYYIGSMMFVLQLLSSSILSYDFLEVVDVGETLINYVEVVDVGETLMDYKLSDYVEAVDVEETLMDYKQ